MAQTADRNLLFGVLALQMDFIKREQLIAAMQAWVFDKSKTLGHILLSQKALAEDNHALLEALVQKHLAAHENDVEKSLAAVGSGSSVKEELEQIADHDLLASLMHVPASPAMRPADMYATMPPMKGTESDPGMRFRILRPHAKGGLGEVFVAHDQELHREVALKEIQERQADNTESRNRFLVEAEITGGLEHPGIVPVYGLGTYADGRPYYAMRFIRGDSLKDAVERFHKVESVMTVGQRTLELRELLGRFVDVCNAIAYAHSRGVLHRDLKPGNIMLGKYGETLVVDWGLAKPLGQPLEPTLNKDKTEIGEGSLIPHSISGTSETLMGSAIGTPQYMSPEQAAGRHDQLGPASDVYSLGATMYCLLTGQAPFSDKDVGTVLQKVQRGDFPKPREIKGNVPAALEAICKKAMALLPKDRYGSPRDLASDIENWLADEPVAAWPEPWTVKARRWANRHAALVTGVASAIAIALVSLTIATVLLSAANERERQAKQKADENFEMARAAVKRYFTEVSNNDLLKEPGMEPLKKKLLEGAKEYNEKFVQQRAGDPTVQAALAVATFQLGQITSELDSELDAIKLHNEAVKLFESLPADKVNNETQADLAACYHHLGRLYRLTDQIKKSEDSYQQALKVWDKLVTDNAKEPRYRDGLARSQLGIGNLYQYTRRLDSAQKSYRNAIENWTPLHEADPKAQSYRRDLGVAHNNLGMIFNARDTVTKSEATKELRLAQAMQKGLVEEAPNVGQYQYDLGKTSFNLGERKEAAQGWQKLVERHPSVSEAHRLLAEAHGALVWIYLQDQDLKKAAESAEKSVSIQRKLVAAHPGVPSYQGDLGRGLFALGGVYHADGQRNAGEKSGDVSLGSARKFYEEAVGIQEKLTGELKDVPPYRRDLARSYSALASVYMMNKENTKADDAFKKSISNWETLIKDHGAEREYTDGLYITCGNLGAFCGVTKKYTDAVAWYTRALEGTDEKFKPGIRLGRAGALAASGKYVEASKEAEDLARLEKDAYKLYLYARVLSLCADAAAADSQKGQADQFAARAITLLEATFANGDLKAPANQKNLKNLKTDTAFNTLRERPEFKKLLSNLGAN